MDLSKFHVLCVISNPMRYGSRYRLWNTFSEDIERKGANLWTVEMQAGVRVHKITSHKEKKHLQIWKTHLPGTLWDKESMINIGIAHIIKNAPDARYIAWIDADVRFEPGMIEEAQHALQHHDVIQLWSHAIDLGPKNETVGKMQQSFMYCYWNKIHVPSQSGYTQGGHSGYAWAARRDALNKLGVSLSNGPLIDFGVLGSADRHIACGLIGKMAWSYHGDVHQNYKKWLHAWEKQAEKTIKRNVGYIPQTIRHSWHGRKAQRGYSSRWKLLVKHAFNPETDLRRDVSGLWILNSDTPRQIRLRDDFRRYFMSRNEDSVDQ
jgi:hypothetical protein